MFVLEVDNVKLLKRVLLAVNVCCVTGVPSEKLPRDANSINLMLPASSVKSVAKAST